MENLEKLNREGGKVQREKEKREGKCFKISATVPMTVATEIPHASQVSLEDWPGLQSVNLTSSGLITIRLPGHMPSNEWISTQHDQVTCIFRIWASTVFILLLYPTSFVFVFFLKFLSSSKLKTVTISNFFLLHFLSFLSVRPPLKFNLPFFFTFGQRLPW